MANTPNLFDPIQLGDLHLPNRVFMAPLTRLRGTVDHIPTPIIGEYYAQRASAGLIISEGIPIDTVAKAIEGSLCFGLFDGSRQIGLARVIEVRADSVMFG